MDNTTSAEQPTGRKFTQHTESRKFKQVNVAPRACQAHYLLGGSPCAMPGEYDAPLRDCFWGDVCEEHMLRLVKPNTQVGFHLVGKQS